MKSIVDRSLIPGTPEYFAKRREAYAIIHELESCSAVHDSTNLLALRDAALANSTVMEILRAQGRASALCGTLHFELGTWSEFNSERYAIIAQQPASVARLLCKWYLGYQIDPKRPEGDTIIGRHLVHALELDEPGRRHPRPRHLQRCRDLAG